MKSTSKSKTFFLFSLFVAIMVLFAAAFMHRFSTLKEHIPKHLYIIDSNAGAYPSINIFSDTPDVSICHIDFFNRILLTNRTAEDSWNQIVLPSKSKALSCSVAVDPITKQPVVLYVNASGDTLSLMRYRADAWSEEVVSKETNQYLFPSLAIDKKGYEHICFSDGNSSSVFYYYRSGSGFIKEIITSRVVKLHIWKSFIPKPKQTELRPLLQFLSQRSIQSLVPPHNSFLQQY